MVSEIHRNIGVSFSAILNDYHLNGAKWAGAAFYFSPSPFLEQHSASHAITLHLCAHIPEAMQTHELHWYACTHVHTCTHICMLARTCAAVLWACTNTCLSKL